MKRLTKDERQIWNAVYAAAFVQQAASFARVLATTPAAVAENPEHRPSIAEAARGIADSAVRGYRETRWAGVMREQGRS